VLAIVATTLVLLSPADAVPRTVSDAERGTLDGVTLPNATDPVTWEKSST
jgi:hypothetical protein